MLLTSLRRPAGGLFPAALFVYTEIRESCTYVCSLPSPAEGERDPEMDRKTFKSNFHTVQAADLIERCLQRGPKARPTAKELFEALQSLLMLPGATLPPVLESAERPSVDDFDVRSDHTSVHGELSPKHTPLLQSTSLGSKRSNSSGSQIGEGITTGETGASIRSTGPRGSPSASKKRLASV